MANSQKSYSAVLSRAHLWCVRLAGGLWFVSLCAILGVVIAQGGECDEAVVVCGWATEGLGGGDNTIRVLAHHSQSTGALPQSTVRVLPEYCHSTARVLVQYSQSTGTALPGTVPQYYQSTGAVLKEYWHSTPRALGECPSQSTDTAQKAHPQSTPRVSLQ